MPDIVNPQIVKFANERARVFADSLEQVYETARRFQAEYAATATIPNTADPVIDGSAADGRKPIQGNHLVGLKTVADTIVSWMETGSPSRITQIRAVSVNGAARF